MSGSKRGVLDLLGQTSAEDLSRMLQPFDEQEAQLQRQMAIANALRQPRSGQHSTGAGAAFGGLGDVLRELGGGLRTHQLEQQGQQLQSAKRAEAVARTQMFADFLRNKNGRRQATQLGQQLPVMENTQGDGTQEDDLQRMQHDAEDMQTLGQFASVGQNDLLHGLAQSMMTGAQQTRGDVRQGRADERSDQGTQLRLELERLRGDRDQQRLGLDREKMEARAKAEAAKIEAYGRRHKGKGSNQEKTLPVTALEGLTDFEVAKNQLDTLDDSFEENDQGSFMGKVGAKATKLLGLQDTDAARYNADVSRVNQAVGKILEGGKLAAGDEEKYRRMQPMAGDSPDIVRRKIDGMKGFLDDIKAGRVKVYKAGGYKVPDEIGGTVQQAGGASSHGRKVGKRSNQDGTTTFVYEDGFQETVK